MKNGINQCSRLLVLAVMLAAARSVSAAETVALSASPSILNVNAGTALATTTVTITYTISGGSTAVNFATSLPVTPTGMSVSALSKTSDTVSGSLTFTVSTTTATPAGAYSIDFNASGGASLSIPILVVIGPEWTGGGADLNWSTPGNWSFPVSSSSAVDFNQGKATTVGVVNNIVSASTTVNSLAFTLGTTGGSAYEVTQISAGQTLTVAENVTVGLDNVTAHVVMTNTGNFTVTGDASSYFSVGGGNATNATKQVATLVLADGTNTITTANLWIGATSGNNGSSGNTLSLGNGTNTINADNILIGQGKASGTLNFNVPTVNGSAGTLTLRNRAGTGRAAIILGNGTSGSGASSGTLSLAGYSANVLASTLTIASVGNSSGGQAGTVTFDTGTLDTTSIIMCSTPSGSGNATGTLTFGGSATTGAATLIVGSAGGGSFIISDANRGSQTGNGTFNLKTNSAAQIYCPITKVTSANNTGTINLTGSSLTLEAAVDTIGTPAIPVDSLNTTNATISLPVSYTVTNIAVSTLGIGGAANTITIASLPAITNYPAQFPLISCPTKSGAFNFTLSTLPGSFTGYLSNNTSSIDLVITNGPILPKNDTWNGNVSGNWDTNTLNWTSGGGATNYNQGDFILFDDTLTGTANVNLTTNLSPATLMVNNTASNYVFSGTGKLGGAVTLVKNGPGRLTLAETGGDSYSGGVTVSNGTLVIDNNSGGVTGGLTITSGGVVQLGNNDANGVLPGGTLTDNGTLVFDRNDAGLTNSSVIGGSGAVVQSGPGILALTGTNTYSGSTTISNGTLQVNNNASLGAVPGGPVTITNGGTLDLGGNTTANNANYGAKQFFVSGAGVGGSGAIINTSPNSQQNTFQKVTLTADATLGGVGRFDVRGGTPTLDLGGHKLTKAGTNQVSIVGATITSGGGSIEIAGGIFSVETTSSFSDNLGSITVDNGGTLGLRTTTSTFTWPITLNGGATLKNTGATGSNYSAITLAGNATLDANSQVTTLNGVISSPGGAFGLTKIGANTFILNGSSTYSGSTVINAGVLALGPSGSISSSTNISLAGGATFDVSALASAFTLGAAQTFTAAGATGTINSNFNLGSGALVLNYTNGTPTLTETNGTFTLNNNPVTVTVSGTALPAGTYKLVSKGTGGLVAGTMPFTVTVNGAGSSSGTTPALQIIGGELYLVLNLTTTSLSSSENPSGFKDSVSFTAHVTPSAATGNFTFLTNGAAWSTNAISGGSATSPTVSTLPRGTTTITAVYSGDGVYQASSNMLNQVVTNHPPTATTMTVMRTPGLGLKIAFSDLATNWSDVDGDSVALTSISLLTTNNVNLSTNASYIFYTNSPNVSDQFTYTIGDGQGGTGAGTVNILVSTNVTGTNSITSIVNNGTSTSLTAYGIPGYSYVTQRSTNLTDWVNIATNTAAADGTISATDTFSDLGGVMPSSAYYRQSWSP